MTTNNCECIKKIAEEIQHSEHPITVLLGGKNGEKAINVIEELLNYADNIILGGSVAGVFAKASGLNIGKTEIDNNCLDAAKSIIGKAKEKNIKLQLPVDYYVANNKSADAEISHCKVNEVPSDKMILDIGVKSVDIFAEIIESSKTLFWRGAMGEYEMPLFSYGTYKTALSAFRATKNGLKTLICGEDTISVLEKYGLQNGMYLAQNGSLTKLTHNEKIYAEEKKSDYSIDKYNFKGKRVLLRVDFNVPLDEKFNITDDTRIVNEMPTCQKILKDGGSLIIMTHIGRPKGVYEDKYSVKHIVPYLSKMFGQEVKFAEKTVGEEAEKMSKALKAGEVMILENLRFNPLETKNDEGFAEQLSRLGDAYVMDAFGTAHRAHASTYMVAKFFPNDKMLGYLVENEVNNINKVLSTGEKPVTAIVGGSKVSTKIDIIKSLITKVDNLVIGGGISYTFIKAMGGQIGRSLVENDYIPVANEILELAKKSNVNIYLPTDCMIGDKFDNEAEIKLSNVKAVPENWEGMDMGLRTTANYTEVIENSKTILWNGPMGVFEMEHFSNGTMKIALAVCRATELGAFTLVGGGDSIAALNKYDLSDKIRYVSTAGGALLEYIEGKELPGLKAINSNI